MSPTLVEDGVWASISYSCHSGMIFERKGTGRGKKAAVADTLPLHSGN